VQAEHLAGADLCNLIIRAVVLKPIARLDADEVIEPQGKFDKLVIAVRVRIGPNQSNQRAEDQQQRIVSDEIPDAIHGSGPP